MTSLVLWEDDCGSCGWQSGLGQGRLDPTLLRVWGQGLSSPENCGECSFPKIMSEVSATLWEARCLLLWDHPRNKWFIDLIFK